MLLIYWLFFFFGLCLYIRTKTEYGLWTVLSMICKPVALYDARHKVESQNMFAGLLGPENRRGFS